MRRRSEGEEREAEVGGERRESAWPSHTSRGTQHNHIPATSPREPHFLSLHLSLLQEDLRDARGGGAAQISVLDCVRVCRKSHL